MIGGWRRTSDSQHQAVEKLCAMMDWGRRQRRCAAWPARYAWDLTEIDGADDLHDADGILADAMARTAALYGARRCWYLVGGSTVGLLAGIRALAPFGSTVIAARNCHKAVYHAIELGRLTAHYHAAVDPHLASTAVCAPPMWPPR